MYSNSESDFDRLSRGSGDSYLDDLSHKVPAPAANTGRGIVVPKTEFVSDLVAVDGHEERASTGGDAQGQRSFTHYVLVRRWNERPGLQFNDS